jgi:hypothetical protein
MDDYPDTKSALLIFLWLLWLAEKRGGTHHGRRDPSHPDDVA